MLQNSNNPRDFATAFIATGAGCPPSLAPVLEESTVLNDAYLFDAGWVFFSGWTIVLVVISLIAFRGDLAAAPSREDFRHERRSRRA